MSNFSIMATARSVPERKVTNDDLAQIMDTSDEWISRRTGIKERRIATSETTSSLATDVAEQLLDKSETSAADLDYIIVATMSSDYQMPSTAATVQGNINANNAAAFDISAACSGFVYGMQLLNSLLRLKQGSKGIIIGAETLSKYIDWSDRSTAVLFGDGAGGILAENGGNGQMLAVDLETIGQSGDQLTAGHRISQSPDLKQSQTASPFFYMNGHAVFDFAIHHVPSSIQRTLEKANLNLGDVSNFVMHQANARIIKSVARHLDVSRSYFPINIERYGNTSAASEPILLSELVDDHKVEPGDNLVLTGFGGGLTAGTIILKY